MVSPTLANAELFYSARAALGEGAVWHAGWNRLLWVDILGQTVNRLDPETRRNESISVGEFTGTVVPAGNETVLVARKASLAHADFRDGSVRPHFTGQIEAEENRFNDGKCDSAGRLWVGSMNLKDPKLHTGFLWCVYPDGRCERKLSRIGCSNGLGWSLDGRSFYYIDTEEQRIDVLDFDPSSGSISNRRPLLMIPKELGSPDGACVDAEGMFWVALWGGHAVIRIDPSQSKIVGQIKLPVSQVTSCAFGGPDLRDLFITSARDGLNDEQLAKEPDAGGIFVARPGVAGLTANIYTGL